MIAKAFQKFSFTSAGISSLLLLVVTYYYLTLEIKWSFVESKIFNGVLIYGALMLSSYAIDTVTRQLTIERSNRNAYHLLLYPLIIICYPIESVDLKFILSSTAVWAAWRNMRIFLELTNNTKRIKPIRKSPRKYDSNRKYRKSSKLGSFRSVYWPNLCTNKY